MNPLLQLIEEQKKELPNIVLDRTVNAEEFGEEYDITLDDVLSEDQMEIFQDKYTSSIIAFMEKQIEGMEKDLKTIVLKKNKIQNDPFHPARCQYLGRQDAIQSQINLLQETIKSMK